MQFISKFFNSFKPNLEKLEKEASDILELPKDLRAIRVNGEIIIASKNKIVERFNDIYPSNPARAAYEILKEMKIDTTIDKKAIWTCGFRDSEDRWVWYKNSEPQMTVSFKEAHPNADMAKTDDLEKKIDFCSAKYGNQIIDEIKKTGIKETAKQINALVLENPYTTIECKKCSSKENYTIDDLVDEKKIAKYDSNFVVCSNCNELVKLV